MGTQLCFLAFSMLFLASSGHHCSVLCPSQTPGPLTLAPSQGPCPAQPWDFREADFIPDMPPRAAMGLPACRTHIVMFPLCAGCCPQKFFLVSHLTPSCCSQPQSLLCLGRTGVCHFISVSSHSADFYRMFAMCQTLLGTGDAAVNKLDGARAINK